MAQRSQPIKERTLHTMSGWLALAIVIAAAAGAVWFGVAMNPGPLAAVSILLGVGALLLLKGLFMISPNEARVLQLFGAYVGTARDEGLRFANPFYSKTRLSLKVRNFECQRLKVNDLDGNPVEIAAVVVWKVVDTAEACFQVENYEHFIKVQAESAVRNLASRYPYDAHDEHTISLRGSTGVIAQALAKEIQERLEQAGVQIVEARITHLAYAPEIAQVMLRRQQATAVIAARTRIVEGAVSMVEMALERLAKNHVVQMDEERKAAMVSNLLVVLCGEREAQPVVNAGTIYQ
ncbi:MAG: SPFH domain-containing protein [Deltaproteobacteria bacterium]|nr:SPFH domain-containing protein [Deltaproteobacteria bacterium]